MTTFSKYISSIILAIILVGCQEDSSDSRQQQPQGQSLQQSQQQLPGGPMQQPAPDIDLSEKEAEKFVDAAMNAQQIQMQGQQEMIGIIKDEGLDVKTFQKIAQAVQRGQPTDTVSDSDMQKYRSANDSIKKVQSEIQEKIANAIEEAGMEVQRFQKISMAAQQDPELQKQIKQKLQEKISSQGSPQGQ